MGVCNCCEQCYLPFSDPSFGRSAFVLCFFIFLPYIYMYEIKTLFCGGIADGQMLVGEIEGSEVSQVATEKNEGRCRKIAYLSHVKEVLRWINRRQCSFRIAWMEYKPWWNLVTRDLEGDNFSLEPFLDPHLEDKVYFWWSMIGPVSRGRALPFVRQFKRSRFVFWDHYL